MGKKFINSILFFIICCNVFAYEFNRSEYYVKVEPTGAGDGSSWKDAMGAQTFAVALSKQSTVKAGVTFHLASGTYIPEYDPFVDEHENYTDNEKARFKAYYISKPINIIGGYSASPKDGDKPNPSLYPTIISGDVLGDDSRIDRYANIYDNLYNLFCIDLSEKKQCTFFGLTLRGTQARKDADDGAFRLGKYLNTREIGIILKVDRCTMEYLSKAISREINNDELEVVNCTFDNVSEIYIYPYKASFNSCTFSNNGQVSFFPQKLEIKNCTFYETVFSMDVDDEILFHNNTVVVEAKTESVVLYDDNEDYAQNISLIGNIFDCSLNYYKYGKSILISKYNLYREINEKMEQNISLSDYVSSYVNRILEKDRDEVYLGKNHGYTRTVKLTRDRLPNGRSIHFDLSETSVTTDQRGVARFDYTCVGSYEKRDTVNTYENHTIIVNEDFYGKKYTKIGIYDSVSVVLPNTVGCDSVTLHKLYVLPNDKRSTFYVKSNGTGDGSSWNNAMSPKDFAFRLYLSQAVDTFHVAAGTYKPIKIDNVRTYYRSIPVCIIGGYPEDSSDPSQKSDPIRYKTIFSIDYNGDNPSDIQNNWQDDSYTVFSYTPTKPGKSLISGIVFEGGKIARDGMNAQCTIEENDVKVGEFNFNQCEFRYSLAKSIRFGSVGVLNVNNCYFNKVESPTYYKEGSINVNACTFENNSCNFTALDGRTINVSNCTMFDCNKLNLSLNSAPSSEIKFSNNTIYSPSVVTTLFLSSSSTNNLYLTGNIIQGNINTDELKDLHSKYNVFLKSDEDVNSFETNYFVSDFSSFLENQLYHVENIVPPVMIMTSDTLPDGTSLRFPLSETSVTTDQRNMNRIRMTSIGSYEAECRKDSSYLTVTDTINAGDIYMGKRITTEGLNYGVDTLYNIMGCDSLIFHPVYVLPEKSIPTAFTPFDSNDKNNIFMQGHEVYIYDIYGILICHSTNGWNGKINDENASAGIYVYAVRMYSGEYKRGTIELLLPQ